MQEGKPGKLIFRRAKAQDTSLLQQMAREIWYDSYTEMISERQIEYMLQTMYSEESILFFMQDNYYTFLVYQEQEPLAYYSIEKRMPKQLLYIHRLYIRQQYQKKGFGRQILQKILGQSLDWQLKVIELNVNRNNSQALTTYKRFGFQIIQELDTAIGKDFFMNDYLMRYSL
ncbi:MAG: GNAT family N-acetyltransferase [Spirochaetota bacterium]